MSYIVSFKGPSPKITKIADADIYKYAGDPQVLVNPRFPKGIPPQYWKIEGKVIGTMSSLEQRLADSKELMRAPLKPALMGYKQIIIQIAISVIVALVLKHLGG